MCSYKNSSVSLSDGECVAGVSEINEVCNGLSKRGTRYLWRGTPPVYGETHLVHTHTHTYTSESARPKNCRWGSNAPPMPEQQVDRHFFFMMSALSMCTFQGEQHEMTEFPAREKDRLGELPFFSEMFMSERSNSADLYSFWI